MTQITAAPRPGRVLNGRRGMMIGLAVLAVVALAGVWYLVPIGEWLLAFTGWIRELGTSGWAVFVLFFVAAALVLVPAAALYLTSGLLYDPFWAFLTAFMAATAASALSFVIARYLARGRITRLVRKRKEFEAVDKAVEDEGWKVVLLLRLAPLVPGNSQGWLFGITRVKFLPFILPTMVGIVPWALLFVGLGSAGGYALASGESPLGPWQWLLVGAGVVVLGIILWLIGRRAKARLEAMGIGASGGGDR